MTACRSPSESEGDEVPRPIAAGSKLVTSEDVSAATDRAAPSPSPDAEKLRVVIYHSNWVSAPTLLAELSAQGFESRIVTSFQEVTAWLMLYGDSAVLVVHPPAVDTFRRSTLEAVRRIAPRIPIVAIVGSRSPEVEEDLRRAHVTQVLMTQSPRGDVVQAVRAVLATSPRSESVPQEQSEWASDQ